MHDILYNIAEYEASRAALRERVEQLTHRIAGRHPLREGESVRELERRRYLLYSEICDLELAITAMRDYLHGREDFTAAMGF